MAIGKNIVKKQKDKLIKNTTEEAGYQPGISNNPEKDTYGTVKKLFYVKVDTFQKLKDYCYFKKITITAGINQLLEKALKGK